ncbi:MAG: ComEC family competence protein [Rhodobacteraceae bacterium]|nr:ComEC family competence protein [Paracoccaceae bacterium]
MRAIAAIDLVLLKQRGALFVWSPVMLAIGIGIYFSLSIEPDWTVYAGLGVLGMACAGAALARPGGWAAMGWALALVAAGFGLAGVRAHGVADPVLGWRYYGPIEGRVVALDRSASDALRVTLDRVRLERIGPDKTPARVRLSLHGGGEEGDTNILPGQRVMTTGHLSPPSGPAEPGGFDFRRHAWFAGLGAVGYTRNPVLIQAPAGEGRAGLRVFTIRMATSARVRAALPGDLGGFAAAITSGDRSGMGQGALNALRASNLAHLLAISGLHMGLLSGFVFAVLRLSLAAIPVFSLRVPVKKLAAIGALFAAAGYLMLSGGNVATERAFVMVAVVLGAVLVDRRAFSLRSVAMAALIVLTLRPEALLGPGFQMSFAATTALVGVFGWMRDTNFHIGPNWLRPVFGVIISSAVAGIATAPIAAAHFNTLAHYGLLANLVSVPLMGVLVIPAAVLAVVLAPLGLEIIGLYLMGLGLRWILGVAHWVSSLDGARGYVVSPGSWVIPLLSLGLLFLIIWQGRARFVGILPALTAFWLWSGAERPAILVAGSGGLVGVMTDQGRALSKPRGAGFVASVWLENDGDGTGQKTAAIRWPGSGGRTQVFETKTHQIVHLIGKRAVAGFDGCKQGQVIIASVPMTRTGPCEIYDLKRLRFTGSLAISDQGIVTARDMSGQRIWNTPARAKRRFILKDQ